MGLSSEILVESAWFSDDVIVSYIIKLMAASCIATSHIQ